jgi:hypothetical protein
MNKILLNLIALLCVTTVSAQFLSEKKNLEKFEGFFNFHYSEESGEIYLEVDKLDSEFLYVHSLRTGLGSNDIGLDRGQLGGGQLVKFIKSGNKLLLVQPNLNYRATSENELERRSINEAFARSVIFGFPIKETIDETYIIDFTPFLMQDTHGVIQRLKSMKEGTYKLDKTRSALWMERTKAFPKNSEFEAMLTYTGTPTGWKLRSVAPDAQSVSVIQHHSFVELPEPGYVPREFDPRSGSYQTSHLDYSTPIWEPIKKRFIMRHRLEKKDTNAAISEAKEPIIYYLDPGTPEPVRSALLEGASWWNQAFEAIGYKDAFQVKMLPADADPMDVRYNVIQWVHRSTRGWSYGATISDPRTGEIIKGHVSLGSLRIRQDFMIAQALMNQPFANSDTNVKPMLDMALARIRQLSAHEVGHTLGFAHNFAASTNNRASVMDYPHPTLNLNNGIVDFSNAYATGIGDWDKVSVAYSYGDVPKGSSEKEYLKSLLDSAFASGLRYITDSDARAQSGAHAKAHLWDNGVDATAELINVLEIRKQAIKNFSEHNIRKGEPLSVLEDVFVPLYFFHRYQTEATVKLIGGMDYDYTLKGHEGRMASYLEAEEQRNALNVVVSTLALEHLMIPKDKLSLFPPRSYGYGRSRESFKSDMGVAFDALGAAATSADMTLKLLLNAERANRLVQQKALDPNNIGFDDVLNKLSSILLSQGQSTMGYASEVKNTIQYTTLNRLFSLLASNKALPQVKAQINQRLDDIMKYEKGVARKMKVDKTEIMRMIESFRDDPDEYKISSVPDIPDGSPIGMDCSGPNYNH